MSEIYASTAERLQAYYDFDDTVVHEVAERAAEQASYETYCDFLNAVGANKTQMYEFDGNSFEMLDIRPKEHDPKKAKIVRIGMGNPLDFNQLYWIGTIAASHPDERIIATGNLSGGSYSGGALSEEDNAVVRSGDFTPLSEPARVYGELSGVEEFDEVDYSLGTHIGMAGIEKHDISGITLIEPVINERLLKLVIDFARTGSKLNHYVAQSDMPTFNDARKDSIQSIPYFKGLFKATNIATIFGLAKDSRAMIGRMQDVVENNLVDRLSVAWGSKTEVGDDKALMRTIDVLQAKDSRTTVSGLRIPGERHLMANDIHLFAALVLQAELPAA